MKFWLRTRRESSGTSTKNKGRLSAPNSVQQDHIWSDLTDSSSMKSTATHANVNTSTAPSSGLATPPYETALNHKIQTNTSNEIKILENYCHKIVNAKKVLVQQPILISSEHYFRLVLESYERLKVVHYRATQEFSLAEWLHIHALLLYGRIQMVQKHLKVNSTSQHNQIDLGIDTPVFAPIATALNAIGAVEDLESSVVYIPDAILPHANYKSNVAGFSGVFANSTLELQQILNGTLYDWQRSWKRVVEARNERESTSTKFHMSRSSSELISAIRDAVNSISRAKQTQLQILHDTNESQEESGSETSKLVSDETVLLDLSQREQQLSQLFEEARNAKDYTIMPPCERVYNDVKPSLVPIVTSSCSVEDHPPPRSPKKELTVDKTADLFTDLLNEELDEKLLFMTSTLELCKSEVDTKEPEDSKPITQDEIQSTRSNLGKIQCLENFGTDSSLNNSVTPQSQVLTITGAHNANDYDSHSSPPSRSVLRKPPTLRISNAKPLQNSPLAPELSPNSLKSTTNPSSLSSMGSPIHTPKNRVKIGGSSELDLFVQYDSELWQGYFKFVEALCGPDLAKFDTLKSSPEGSYAWMIPVKIDRTNQAKKTSLVLPRRSIPQLDLVLALILQTSHASPDLAKTWHITMTAELNLRQLLADYVDAAVIDMF